MATIALTQLTPGQIAHLPAEDLPPELGSEHASLLRAMGLRPNAAVRLCRLGDPCVVQIGQTRADSCRLGLARHVADRITVCVAPDVCAAARA